MIRFLNDIELEKNAKHYKNNKIKQDAYKQYSNLLAKKNYDFDEIWNFSINKIARRFYAFGRYPDYKNLSNVASTLIKEMALFDESYLEDAYIGNRVINRKNYENYDTKIYKKRIKKFVDKYGKFKFTYEGKTRNLETWLRDFTKGKINAAKMTEVIKYIKIINPEYPGDETYKGRNVESNSSVGDFFE